MFKVLVCILRRCVYIQGTVQIKISPFCLIVKMSSFSPYLYLLQWLHFLLYISTCFIIYFNFLFVIHIHIFIEKVGSMHSKKSITFTSVFTLFELYERIRSAYISLDISNKSKHIIIREWMQHFIWKSQFIWIHCRRRCCCCYRHRWHFFFGSFLSIHLVCVYVSFYHCKYRLIVYNVHFVLNMKKRTKFTSK